MKPRTPGLFDLDPPPPRAAPAPPVPRPGLFVRVALNGPLRREFTYAVPPALAARAAPGARVAVPFGPRRAIGVIVALEHESALPPARVKDVLLVLDDEPVIGPELLSLTRWIAERYACSWGEALAAVLPAPLKRERARRRVPRIAVRPGVGEAELETLRAKHPEQHRLLRTLIELGTPALLREILRSLRLSESPAKSLRKRGWVAIEFVEEEADPLESATSVRARPERLSQPQTRALERVTAALGAGRATTFLLHGVTGSGKTEVYLRAIERALELGRGAIVLVPEIALTPQTVGWFRARFGAVSVLHSRMGDSQRLSEWRRVQSGAARVVVGARSAVFAPVRDLGVVVVDEEHEPSFKQESVPRYHAREVAVERARAAGAVCLLGSATPSLEAWRRGQTGVYEVLSLPERVGGGAPCSVQVVDMRLDAESAREAPLFSRVLRAFLGETIARREQAILFLNRRGYVPVLWCPGCQSTLRCTNCDTALTFHRRIQRLVCHTCCRERDMPGACPTCSRPGLRQLGVGSERVEADLRRLFPEARVRRMDSDTMRRRQDYEECLGAFERHEVDVLVGTQMIAKGLDFPRVTLVGIVAADLALDLPDFRASERTFQLIAQVAGRAGRGTLPGRVVVQTRVPDQAAVRFGARADYRGFVEVELAHRKSQLYPPAGRLIRVVFEDKEEARVAEGARRCAEELGTGLALVENVEIKGPMPAPVALLRGRYRHHLLVTLPLADARFEQAVERLLDFADREARPAVKIDVDPMALL